MPHKITSIIEISYDEDANMPKHKKHHVKDTVENGEIVSQEKKPNHYRSEAVSDKNRFFHQTKSTAQGATQTTTVTVNIDQKEDCLTGCFGALARCFSKGAAGA